MSDGDEDDDDDDDGDGDEEAGGLQCSAVSADRCRAPPNSSD